MNNNLSVLPFYTNIDEQTHRRAYSFGNIYPLYTPQYYLPTFQIAFPKDGEERHMSHAWVCNPTGDKLADIVSELSLSSCYTESVEYDGQQFAIYNGEMPLSSFPFAEGQYYLQIEYMREHAGAEQYYSEVFTIIQQSQPYLRIEWADTENMVTDGGTILYEEIPYKNKLYLCTELGKPEYTFTDEGENRDGRFFPIKQISAKTYRCVILATEYLCDVMRLIRMADFVKVTDKYGNEYKCDTFLITPTWQTQGELASVEIEFTTDTIAKKIGRGYTQTTNGDYNNDFNNDFKNG